MGANIPGFNGVVLSVVDDVSLDSEVHVATQFVGLVKKWLRLVPEPVFVV